MCVSDHSYQSINLSLSFSYYLSIYLSIYPTVSECSYSSIPEDYEKENSLYLNQLNSA